MKLRPVHFSLRSIAAAGFATLLAMASGLFIAVTPAAAAGVASLTVFAISSPATIPTISVGKADQAASNISFTMPNSWVSGDTIVIQLAPNAGTNCSSNTDYVGFQGTPSVTSSTHAGDTTPTFSVLMTKAGTDPGGCGVGNDVMTATLTNTASPNNSDAFTVTVSGIFYNVGTTADTGNVDVAIAGDTTKYFNLTTATKGTVSPPSNATVSQASATANNPATDATNNGGTGTISNIVVTEGAAGAINGSLCITPLSSAAFPTNFAFTTAGAAAFSGGTAGVAGTPVLAGGAIQVPITTMSTGAGTYTISGAGVTTSGATTGPAAATVTTGGANCGADTTPVATGLVVLAPTVNTAIAGADADATAIAEMATSYPPPSSCPSNHAVVLATDQNFPDALAASYLAGNLGTGILLTPTANLSAETQAALQNEGITSVYVVGGTLAISANTISQVNATPAYTCGGVSAGTKTGSNIAVVQTLAGQTEYDTAQQIAALPGSSNVHSFNLSGAYAGQYNDTAGNESSTPSATGALRTAIVATGASYQDAAGASVLAYNNQFPVVLTDPNTLSAQAQTTLQALGITQAIVLGGPLAVSTGDVTTIQGLGISVIRVAGSDATDTAQELATFELQSTASNAGLGWSTGWGNKILVARGDFFSDALAGAVLAAHGHTTPLLLTENPSTVGTPLSGFLNQGGTAAGIDGLGAVGNIQTIQPLGGSLALFFSTLTSMAAAVAAG